ncbi:MAG: UDP-N-acetylglucosamine 1-carboxyvinyltransferase [Patescibacteria group bacterium]
MSKFVIHGGGKIAGEVRISGMKNAATPLLAATLLTRERCVLRNVPKIRDVFRMLDILKGLGARVEWIEDHSLVIEAVSIDSGALLSDIVAAMRSSILLLGPLLVRAGEVEIPEPGGCIIGNRPIDTHLYALAELGATAVRKNGKYLFQAPKLLGAVIILPEFSVTATENVLMAACLAEGETVIKLAAAEPHVQDLVTFLQKMGAKISGSGTHTLVVEGVKELHGAEHTLIPDQIEIGTFAAAAAATRGSIEMYPVIPEHLDIILLKLRQIGVRCDIDGNRLRVQSEGGLRAFRLQAMPYPGFPTDLQAPFGVLATQCNGTTLIHDPLFEGRMGYVAELVKMGAGAIVADPHRVIITGPTPLYGQQIRSLDLRAGATLVIAGIVAEGETVIDDAEVIDRGYEDLDGRLRALGVKIDRVS